MDASTSYRPPPLRKNLPFQAQSSTDPSNFDASTDFHVVFQSEAGKQKYANAARGVVVMPGKERKVGATTSSKAGFELANLTDSDQRVEIKGVEFSDMIDNPSTKKGQQKRIIHKFDATSTRWTRLNVAAHSALAFNLVTLSSASSRASAKPSRVRVSVAWKRRLLKNDEDMEAFRDAHRVAAGRVVSYELPDHEPPRVPPPPSPLYEWRPLDEGLLAQRAGRLRGVSEEDVPDSDLPRRAGLTPPVHSHLHPGQHGLGRILVKYRKVRVSPLPTPHAEKRTRSHTFMFVVGDVRMHACTDAAV